MKTWKHLNLTKHNQETILVIGELQLQPANSQWHKDKNLQQACRRTKQK
jgi:hypothetical protein